MTTMGLARPSKEEEFMQEGRDSQYKFVTVQGSCGSGYDVKQCEGHANRMLGQGYELIQVYQSSVPSCFGGSNSTLVMVFRTVP